MMPNAIPVVSLLLLITACSGLPGPESSAANTSATVWLTTRDGQSLVGTLATGSLRIEVGDRVRSVALADLASLHMATPASEYERHIIDTELPRLGDVKQAAAATAALVTIGLPVLTPLLRSYEDTDGHEPDQRYRLFQRLMPGFADCRDRELDLVRLADGEVLRGRWVAAPLILTDAGGVVHDVEPTSLRRIAVQRAVVTRHFDLHALHHCTYVAWLDTGVSVTPSSQVRADARGYVRLSFDEDGWASDPDGILDPLPGKRRLQEGFRWGAVLYRIGHDGERSYAGSHLDTPAAVSGRLHFVVNDNEHWQNNIGSYRLQVEVSDAFDLAEAQ